MRPPWRLLTGLVQVCATTARAMLRHVLNARDVKVPGVWKFKPFTNLRGHLAQRPDVSEDVSVFRLRLEVELNESLERATHSRLWRVASSVAKNPPRTDRRQ